MRNFFNGILTARQNKANREIATFLQRSEFKGESYAHVLSMVEDGTIHDRLGSRLDRV